METAHRDFRHELLRGVSPPQIAIDPVPRYGV